MAQGRLVILNGTSSAGKTTLATSFRDGRAHRGDYWLLTGIDDAIAKLPPLWIDLGPPTQPGARAVDGMYWGVEDGVRRLRFGPVMLGLVHVYHQTVAAAVRSGINVIVDDVVVDRAVFESWQSALDGLIAEWVAVRCPKDVAEQREHARGDRAKGLVAAQYDVVHRWIRYSFEIDTGVLDRAAALDALCRGLGI